MLASAAPSSVQNTRPGEPAMVALEQGLSLTAFMRDLPQVAALVERAALQLDDAERHAREIAEGDIGPEALERLERARHGATLLATVDLARACLYAGLVGDGSAAKDRARALTSRLPEPRLRSIVAFAAMTGAIIGELGRTARTISATMRGR